MTVKSISELKPGDVVTHTRCGTDRWYENRFVVERTAPDNVWGGTLVFYVDGVDCPYDQEQYEVDPNSTFDSYAPETEVTVA
jgi:hypothetical protein